MGNHFPKKFFYRWVNIADFFRNILSKKFFWWGWLKTFNKNLNYHFVLEQNFTRKNLTCHSLPASRENFWPLLPNLKLGPCGADRRRRRKFFEFDSFRQFLKRKMTHFVFFAHLYLFLFVCRRQLVSSVVTTYLLEKWPAKFLQVKNFSK